jgi:hypothetical protein
MRSVLSGGAQSQRMAVDRTIRRLTNSPSVRTPRFPQHHQAGNCSNRFEALAHRGMLTAHILVIRRVQRKQSSQASSFPLNPVSILVFNPQCLQIHCGWNLCSDSSLDANSPFETGIHLEQTFRIVERKRARVLRRRPHDSQSIAIQIVNTR